MNCKLNLIIMKSTTLI